MSLLPTVRSGTLVLRKEIGSKVHFSNSFSGTLELETDSRVSDFLRGADTFIVRKLSFRFQPFNSYSAPVSGYARLEIDFDASHVTSSVSADESGTNLSSRYRQVFSFPLKFSSPSFPVSHNKLLYRQYSTRDSSGSYKLPILNFKLDTAGVQSKNVGFVFVDWVLERTTGTPSVIVEDDAVDT